VKFYRAAPLNTIPAGQDRPGGAGLPGSVPVIAIRAADLMSPAGRPAGGCG